MTLSYIEDILADLSAEEVIGICGFATLGRSEGLVAALADHIEENQESILENLEAGGVI